MLKASLSILILIMFMSCSCIKLQEEQHLGLWNWFKGQYDCRTSNALPDYKVRFYVSRERLRTQQVTWQIGVNGQISAESTGVVTGKVGADVKYTVGKKLKTDQSYTQLSAGATKQFYVSRSGDNFLTITVLTKAGEYVLISNDPINGPYICRNVIYRVPSNNQYVSGVIADDKNFRFLSTGNTGSSAWQKIYPPGYY